MADLKLTMIRGDTPSWTVTLTGEDGVTPIDLTGAAVYFTGKRKLSDPDTSAVFQKSIGAGVTLTDAVHGQCLIALTNGDTAALPDLDVLLRVDLEVVESTGNIATAAAGTLLVSPDVTLAT